MIDFLTIILSSLNAAIWFGLWVQSFKAGMFMGTVVFIICICLYNKE